MPYFRDLGFEVHEMESNELNLMELTEAELQHISEVLYRDKKLQERSNHAK